MYRVQLQDFEGPLDLLFFFIKRDELDIYNIPISYITDEFLEYIHLLEELDLQVASEFIYMASLLMSIKAKMMLPREKDDDELEEEEDPRYELVQSLLEYRRFKEMGEKLVSNENKARKSFKRGNTDIDQVHYNPNSGEALREISLFDLMSALKVVLDRKKTKPKEHHIDQFQTNIEQRIVWIHNQLKSQKKASFIQLCAEIENRITIVITFLAVLEMIKEHKLNLYIGQSPMDFQIELLSENLEMDFKIDSYS